ncbi:Eco57I restriction-modification methylase domain-containing protein [Corynebacterium kefirresidentii]|uniref:Eco57I restriction-modification methylase domain-containing protein n=1 Tax=Corynebacterium sp. MSK185 TaxID=3377092 RepID=UPI00254F4244|nr:Eco57I restriction-modification methylase domain-containing protein [Corynebacterium kefirresidentii]MDK8585745.1 Eco57I restriction-modification methylase domain-containing protein [Corynebacterium kefirresidentii]
MTDNSAVLDQIIVGRVTPHIYAFTTNTVPSYLKVGDTYRPVDTRLREWERHFPALNKEYEAPATINGDVYFRDFAVHRFLEESRKRLRLTAKELSAGVYYSREFFKDANIDDVKDAISDIHHDFERNSGRYDFYDVQSQLPQPFHFARGAEWTLRPNQQEAVDNFVRAVDAGRTNLLMYAVMRFGKSFTALSCANAIDAKTVLIVSAKADVRSEWKKAVESAGNFKNWVFIDQCDLTRDEHILDKAREADHTTAIFLTLQDLQGRQLKEKHRQVFASKLDLLIVDETHFGARAEEYGRVLRDAGQPMDPVAAQRRDHDDKVDIENVDLQLKQLNPRIRLHLSGTPYRILMGSEFEPEDIVSFVQFSDIVREQEAWDAAHLDDDDTEEWDNPYFGFPQMVRFAFNPNESSRRRMTELRKSGVSFAFSALFEPISIKQDPVANLHREFKHEPEILDLLRVIDGSKQDENLLGFLDYSKIKAGQMCRHMVMVLPYCASCDAMEQLINDHKDEFKNLGSYKIINISGVEGAKAYKTPEDIKSAIADAEDENRKTLTLTVNRMLTGSTVKQWDTMLFLKDTASPQEYDQAIFRLQNQYIRTLVSSEGETIKENLKPQTLLVDFDPGRMFHMQEQKSLIYNVNTEHSGNDKLEERLQEELRISPIITINHNKIHQVEAVNILDAVSAYNNNRSIADEAQDIPVDLGLLDNGTIRRVIEAQAEIGSRQGLSINPVEGEEDEIDIDDEEKDGKEKGSDKESDKPTSDSKENELRSLEKRLQTYYQRILFFAMLTNSEVRSLSDVIDVMGVGDNVRLAANVGLDTGVLWEMMDAFDPFKLNTLDYKIQNISHLGRDESLPPIERATRALAKFSRISDSEIRTPQWLCDDMIALIPGGRLRDAVTSGHKVLDIASKSGEFAVALYQRLTEELHVPKDIARKAIFSIPTSTIAYEFTRRFYEILGLDVCNISREFNAYDLLPGERVTKADRRTFAQKLRKEWNFSNISVADPEKGGEPVRFAAVVGNPPYHKADNDSGKGSAQPIYNHFVNLGLELNPSFLTLITPSVWFVGGKGLDTFRREMTANRHLVSLTHFSTSQDVFPQVNLRGGVSYFLIDADVDNSTSGIHVSIIKDGEISSSGTQKARVPGLEYFIPDSVAVNLLSRLIDSGHIVLDESSPLMFASAVSPRNPYGLTTTFPESAEFHDSSELLEDSVKIYASRNRIGYAERKTLSPKHLSWIDRWKVLTPFANNLGTNLPDDNFNTIIGEPGSVSTETFLVIGADLDLRRAECHNVERYMRTKFVRFLISLAKANQNGTRKTYKFVPMQDFTGSSSIDWNVPVADIDLQLFELYGLSTEERQHISSSIKDMD